MWIGISALLTRALQLDARQLRTHLFRLVFVMFIYFSLLMAQAQSMMFGAPGLRFLSNIVYLNAILITLAGVSFFSSAITEEKEESTLGLLQMAGIGPMSVLLGKSTSRFVQAFMLLLVQFPFTLLSITLGGVTMQQVVAAYLALLAFLYCLANVALFWSVICRRTGNAAGLTALSLFYYFVAPELASLVKPWLISKGWSPSGVFSWLVLSLLDIIRESDVFRNLSTIMSTGFSGFYVDSTAAAVSSRSLLGLWNAYVYQLFSVQVISNFLFGAACFGLARLVYEPFTRDITQVTETRGLVLKSNNRMRMFSAGRAWNNPLVWKEYQFLTGGYPGAIVRWFAYAGVLVLIAAGNSYANSPYQTDLNWQEIFTAFVSGLLMFLVLESAIYASRMFHDEIRLQTMSALLMLPHSVRYLAYSKAAGAAMGLLPVLFWLAIGGGGLFIFHHYRFGYHDLFDDLFTLVLFNPFLWGILLVYSLFLHLTVLLSLFVKWGALPLAFLIVVIMFWCCPVFSLMFMFIATAMDDTVGQIAMSVVLVIINGVSSFVLQMMIGARLQEIGST